MKNIALQKIKNMQVYSPPLSGRGSLNGLLLDFNERTIPASAKVQEVLKKFLYSEKLQVYPEYADLEKVISKYVGVDSDQIALTNGSDQAIDLVFRTFTKDGDNVIIPSPSFAMFFQFAQIAGTNILSPLYGVGDLSFPSKEVLRMINPSVKLVIVCNPNNPTGTLVKISEIEKIAQKAPSAIVLVDEAYFEFSKTTAVKLINKYPNIIVTRTFSKAFGLSSLRIGYIIANKTYIEELKKIRAPYDVNMAAAIAASTAIEDKKNMKDYVDEVMMVGKPMVEEFFKKNKIIFYKSSGNFILFKPENAEEVERILKENGVLVRLQNKKNIENTLRITIGTARQMKEFISIYQKKILKKKNKYAFIDRDGTLIFEPQDTYQVDSIEKLQVLPGVIDGLKLLSQKGYELILVSNQDGLGTSSYPRRSFEKVQNRLFEIFKKEKISFKEILICPHFPNEKCLCRKPKTKLVKDYLKKEVFDKNNSFVCGDRSSDKTFAKNLGLKFFPIETNGNFYEAVKGVML